MRIHQLATIALVCPVDTSENGTDSFSDYQTRSQSAKIYLRERTGLPAHFASALFETSRARVLEVYTRYSDL